MNCHRALAFCLGMVSAQTLRVCREGKPLHTFPDHASRGFRRRPMRVLVDRADDLRPRRHRDRVSHAFDHHQLRAGDRSCRILATHGMHQGVDGAMDDQGRRLYMAQAFLAAAGGEDGAELAADAGGIEPAIPGAFGTRAVERLVLGERSRPAAFSSSARNGRYIRRASSAAAPSASRRPRAMAAVPWDFLWST